MNTAQVTACLPGICVKNISWLHRDDSTPFILPMSVSPCSRILMTLGEKPSLGLKCQPILKSRKPLRVCSAGGKGKMENNDENSPWKSLTSAMEKFKGKSIEDVLRQQIQKGEYVDSGGGEAKPPGGGGGGGDGGSGSPDGTGGFEDDTLQVILATGALLSFYVYLVRGKEIFNLILDYIKYLSGGELSSRLRRVLVKLGMLYKSMGMGKKKVVDEYWLEKAILNTPTWWYDPRDFRRAVKNYYASASDEDEDEDE